MGRMRLTPERIRRLQELPDDASPSEVCDLMSIMIEEAIAAGDVEHGDIPGFLLPEIETETEH